MMDIFLSESEQNQVRDMAVVAAASSIPGAYASIYQWVADLLESKGVSSDNQTLLWLRGATEANAGRGAMSALIREYTAKQIELRYGKTITDAQMQLASDQVARNLIRDLIGPATDEWPTGKVPDIERIARADATAVGTVLFSTQYGMPGRDDSDTPLTSNAAWSGTLLFGLLRSDQAGRLVNQGNLGQLDTLTDLRDVLYAHRSFATGLKAATLSSLSTAAQIANPVLGPSAVAQLYRDSKTMLTTIAALKTLPDIPFSWNQAAVNFATNPVVKQAFTSITEATPARLVDMLYGAWEGQARIGTTTDDTLDARSSGFFSQWTTNELKNRSARFVDLKELATLARTDVNARAALAGLSFVLLDTKRPEDQALSLINPATGLGNLSTIWIDDRAAMVSWLTKPSTPTNGGFASSLYATGIATYRDYASGISFRVNPGSGVPDPTKPGAPPSTTPDINLHDAQARLFLFGSRNGDNMLGGANEDRIYGDAGNDTMVGGAGSDYMEGGLGNDVIQGDGIAGAAPVPGKRYEDTIYGGEGNDTVSGGLGNDYVSGGVGDDELYGDEGNDYVIGGRGADKLSGGDGNDYLFDEGGSDTNTLRGDGGNDVLEIKGGTGIALLDGGGGNDILIGGQGGNSLNGATGNDSIRGGADLDIINGGDGADLVEAGAGNDEITGGKGADYLKGGAGSDTYNFTGRDFGVDLIEDASGGDKILADGASPGTASYNADKRAWIAANGMEIRKYDVGGSTTLALSYAGDSLNTIYLRDWTSGRYGINLTGEPTERDRPQVALTGPFSSELNNFVDVRTDNMSADALDGGQGNDVLFGTDESSMLVGGTGNDLLSGFRGDDWLEGGDDNDVIFTGEGKDYADGGAGNDLLFGGLDFLVVRSIDNKLYLQNDDAVAGSWILSGSIATNTPFVYFAGTQAFEVAHPELAVFDIKFETERANLDGYDGRFWWHNPESGDANLEPALKLTVQVGDVSLGDNKYLQRYGQLDTVPANLGQPLTLRTIFRTGGRMLLPGSGIEGVSLHGGAGDDVVYGTNNHDKLTGDADNDLLVGYDGDDELDGGDGDDELSGGAGRDFLQGGKGEDNLIGGYGADVLHGGDNDDQLYGDAMNLFPTNALPPGLDTGQMGGDYLVGGAGDDGLWGNFGDDYLFGGTGDDSVSGGEDNDHGFGEAGDDALWGGKGDDYLDGGADKDFLYGGEGNDLLLGGTGEDDLHGEAGDDILDGGANNDVLFGEDGQDNLRGGDGNDKLYGDGGESKDGDDILEGGAGNDELSGQGGSDLYIFSVGDGQDIVRDDGASGSRNVIAFKFGSGEVRVLERDGTDLLIKYGTDDQVRVVGYYLGSNFGLGSSNESASPEDGNDPQNAIAEIRFDDGAVWGREDILAKAPPPPPGEVPPDPFAALSSAYFVNALISRETIKAAGKHVLSFSFATLVKEGVTGAYSFTDAQKQSVRDALSRFSDVLNLSFVELGNDAQADLSFHLDDLMSEGLGAFAGYATPATGEVHLNSSFYAKYIQDGFGNAKPQRTLDVGTSGFETLLHEIGHALGLKHPFEAPVLPNAENTNANTVMSYTRPDGPATQLAAFDVAALQLLFGVAASINGNSDVHQFGARWVQDSGGYDVLDASAEAQGVSIDLTPGSWNYRGSQATSILADNQSFLGFNTVIEAASGGAGNDTLKGNAEDNVLYGGAGNDVLQGGGGTDYLQGGEGSDTYVFASGSEVDRVQELENAEGVDVVRITDGLKPADIQLLRLYDDLVIVHGADRMVVVNHFIEQAVEGIVFDDGTRWDAAAIRANVTTGMTAGADVYPGTNDDDRVDGYEGDDAINGLNGADTLLGGAGNDTLSGDAGNDSLIGGEGVDSLLGGAGDDFLAEGEFMDGGAGSDVYVWDTSTGLARISESAGDLGDIDTLRLASGVLPADLRLVRSGNDLRIWTPDGERGLAVANYFGGNVIERFVFENGTVWNPADIGAAIEASAGHVFQGTAGNDVNVLSPFDDEFDAGAGDDRIDGKGDDDRVFGGAGRDSLSGGNGNDLIDGGQDDDQLFGGDGNDVLEGQAGNDVLHGDAGNDMLTGGEGANLLDGGAGNDRLNSLGRGARDTMLGGEGDDTYALAYGTTADVTSSAVDSSTTSNDVYLATPFDGATSSDVRQTWTINDAGGTTDELRFSGSAITAASTLIRSTATGFTITGANLNVVIENAVNSNGLAGAGAIEQVTLGDGTTYSFSQLKSESLRATTGNDSIVGFGGDDTLDGGAGNDTLVGGRGSDTYRFGRGGGQDVITDVFGDNDRVEFGPGITAADLLFERSGNDLVVKISGSTDSLTFTNWGVGPLQRLEQFQFADGSVKTADQLMRNYDLTHMGDAGDNGLTGTSGSDQFNAPVFLSASTWSRIFDPVLIGNLPADIRAGRDTMIGGAGDDIYYTNSINGEGDPFIWGEDDIGYADDAIVELAGEGHDTEVTTAYRATLADNVEDLVSFNRQSYYHTTTFRKIDHRYTGNALNNVLDASRVRDATRLDGGAGADTLIGSVDGSNTYVIDNVGDVILNEVGPGDLTPVDTVETAMSYALTEVIENLVLTGSAATVGTGNAKNNVIDGSTNTAANTLVGGLGDDTYRVDTSDVIVENEGEGTDTVVIVSAGTTTMFTLNPGVSVERLVLDESAGAVGVQGSGGDDRFVGNSQGNVMIGGAGNDDMDDGWIINPLWGRKVVSGYDVMDGGAGDDRITTHGDGDLITGGTGNDTISLNFDSWGWATIRFNRGDGADVIGETSAGSVQLEYGGDLDITNLVMARSGDDLVLAAGNAGDSMTFGRAFVDPGASPFLTTISAVTFGDGLMLTGAELQTRFVSGTSTTVTEDADLIVGTSGADSLSGAGGDDRIAAGAGNDVLDGGDGHDLLSGGLGSDDLTGGLGYDTLAGGLGDDVYRVNAGDGYDEINDAGGTDTIVFGAGLNEADLTVSTNWKNELVLGFNGAGVLIKDGRFEGAATNVEFVRFADGTVRDIAYLRSQIAVWGSADADDLLGDASDERLRGLAGNDTLDGGGGADTLFGGEGDDTYVVDSNDDVVVEEVNQGTDLVRSSVSYTLSANVENIVLTGTASISATGNALNNKLDGNAGANRLDGGLGADAMKGGAGDDIYVVDNTGDIVTESSNQGTDKVLASVNYTLGSNVEQLELTGSSDITGTGNTLANVLIGNAGANVLTGGTGNDTMSGGLGNDTYVVDVVGDVVNENANEGIDLVQSAVNWTLGANVENLTLTGSNATNGTGNGLDNVLTGNGNANKLDGGAGNDSLVGAAGADSLTGGTGNDTLDGGAGNDTMLGGAGDDFYVVDATTDAITENASEGTDTVLTSVTLTLVANVENVTLATGTTALSATGNGSNNMMIGNAGANTLTGAAGNDTLQGGLGNDSLVGGAGADLYLFNKGDGTDTIQDSDSTSGVLDQLTFGTGITRSGTTFKKVSNNLEITFTGTTTDKVVIKDWYLGAANQVERVVYADGTVMTNAQVNTAAGQPAGSSTAKTAMVKTSADRELVGTYQEWLMHTGSDSTGFDQTVTRQADALIEAMASFSGSSGMATNASLPLYTGEFRDQFAVSAR